MAQHIPKGSSFKLVTEFTTDYSPTTITKYESSKTGMSAVVIERTGPKVFGFFSLATEIFDDSGAPHTLEHLIFMGSKNYRYKGLLDRLASRAYSDTNAWTDTDNTTYTLETAGWKGFAMILPVYLEHLLLPTLTDAGCYTEVHHVNGEGEDAGVVYSEMQGVQNTESSLMELASQRALYPEGVGYRYETGGMMENLRVLTAERIRQFHKAMYNPRNLCLVIIGEVDHTELLTILDEFEEGVGKDIEIPGPEWNRPFVDSKQTPPLKKSVAKTVEFPEEDESVGEVTIDFLGPDFKDAVGYLALEVLKLYLAGSSISVLEARLVETEDPYAGSVYFTSTPRLQTHISLTLSSVNTDRLKAAEKKLFEVLREVVDGKDFDGEFLKDCIDKVRRTAKKDAETSPYYFSTFAIADHLYGDRQGKNLENLKSIKIFDELEGWSEKKWRDFMRKWLVENKHVTIYGKPSAALAKKNEEEEVKRVEAQVKKIGPEGLKQLAEKLEKAKAENDTPIPDEVLRKFKIPPTDSIHFIETKTGHAGFARKPTDTFPNDPKGHDIPLHLHFEQIPSNFIQISLVISTSNIEEHLLPLLPIFEENFFNTGVVKEGVHYPYEAVVSELEKNTVDYGIGLYSLDENLKITIQVEPEKYEDTIRWLQALLFDSIFEPKRLAVRILKLRSELPEEKRSGSGIKAEVFKNIAYERKSLQNARNVLTKSIILRRLAKFLKDMPGEAVEEFEDLRKQLCKLENMRILVTGDIEKLKSPIGAWGHLLREQALPEEIIPLTRRKDKLSEAGANPKDICYIIPMATIDSTFSTHVAMGPQGIDDPAVPALLLAISYLCAVEGPIWRSVRGNGLAYGASFHHDRDSGHIFHSIYRSPDASKAFAAAKKVITDHLDNTTPFDELALEAAKSAVAVALADQAATQNAAADISFLNEEAYGKGKDWPRQLLQLVEKVTTTQVKETFEKYLLPIFSPSTSIAIITSTPNKVDEITSSFAAAGFKPVSRELKEFYDDYGLFEDFRGDSEDEEDESEVEMDLEEFADVEIQVEQVGEEEFEAFGGEESEGESDPGLM